jgi:2-hydroxy-3-oxopropionate reductase
MSARIAFLGLGLMGGPMTRNLLEAGYAVTVWNRTAGKAEALTTVGAVAAASPADAVREADFIIAMVSDGRAVESLIADHGVAVSAKPGAIFIDMSSIKPEQARAHASYLKAHGIEHLDAPVSGGTKGATDGMLAIMVGGEEAIFNKAKPVLAAMGRPVLVGPSGCGQLAKLANQGIVATTIGAVAEAMLMMKAGGADMNRLREALKGGFADSTILQQHGKRMAEGDFRPGGRSSLQLKDLNNLLEEAGHLGLSLPLAELQRERFRFFVEDMDGGEKDHSALFLELQARQK